VLHVEIEAEPVAGWRHWLAAPGRGAWDESRNIGGVSLEITREPLGRGHPLPFDRGRIDQDEERNYHEQERPVRGDGEARGDQEAAEVERVPGVGVGPGCRQPFVLRDVAGSPATDDYPGQRNRTADGKRQEGRQRKNQVENAEDESEGQPETLGQQGVRQSASSFRRCRAITSR